MKKFIYSLTFVLVIILIASFNCYAQYDQSGGAWGSTKNYLSVIQNNTVPSVDDTYDLGSSTKKWRDLYIDGNAYIDQLGINTSTPRRALDVLDPNNAQIRGSHTDNTNYFEIQADPNGDAIFTASGGEISFDDENLSTSGTLNSGDITIDKHRPFIYFDPNSGDTQWHVGVLSDANGTSDDSFQIGTGTDPNSNAKVMIDSSGNVGIGTTTSEASLHIDRPNAVDGLIIEQSGTDDYSDWFLDIQGANNQELLKLGTIFYVGNAGVCINTGSTTSSQIDSKVVNLRLVGQGANYIPLGIWGGAASRTAPYFAIASGIYQNTTSDILVVDSSGNLGINTSSPDALLHAEKSTAGTNSLQEVSRISVTTTSTPTAGFGPEITFESETDPNSAGHTEVIASIGAPIEDTTTDSEDGGIAFRTMTNGATRTEKMRLQSDGDLVVFGSYNYGIDTAATDAYVVDLDPNLSAYRDGFILYFDPNHPNIGACTLRLTGGLAFKAIKTQGHDDPPDNYIEADGRPGVMFNSGADYWILITPDANP